VPVSLANRSASTLTLRKPTGQKDLNLADADHFAAIQPEILVPTRKLQSSAQIHDAVTLARTISK